MVLLVRGWRCWAGATLKAGDTVVGYEVEASSESMDPADVEQARRRRALPDVVVVRKLYGADSRKRGWALKKLEVDLGEEEGAPRAAALAEEGRDYERFMQQLEGDKEMRKQVNLYKNEARAKAKMADDDEGGARRAGAAAEGEEGAAAEEGDDEEAVRLNELLAGLAVDDDTYHFKVDPEDEKFLSGKFVAPEGVLAAAVEKQLSPAAAAALLSDPSPPKFNFL